jgi:hypothetical protein
MRREALFILLRTAVHSAICSAPRTINPPQAIRQLLRKTLSLATFQFFRCLKDRFDARGA